MTYISLSPSPPPPSFPFSVPQTCLPWNERSGAGALLPGSESYLLWFLGASGFGFPDIMEELQCFVVLWGHPHPCLLQTSLAWRKAKIFNRDARGSCSSWKDSLKELQAASQTPRRFQVTDPRSCFCGCWTPGFVPKSLVLKKISSQTLGLKGSGLKRPLLWMTLADIYFVVFRTEISDPQPWKPSLEWYQVSSGISVIRGLSSISPLFKVAMTSFSARYHCDSKHPFHLLAYISWTPFIHKVPLMLQ